MTQGFDDAVNGHKSNLTKSMKDFGEDGRIHHLLRDIDLNICDYEYYFNQGKKSRQAEIEELQKRIDKAIVQINLYYDSNGMEDIVLSDISEILKGEK